MSEPSPKNNPNTPQAEQTGETTIPLLAIPTDRVLTENDLPSHEQLNLLLELRGKDALVFYAWRNALRALPFIAEGSVIRKWGKTAVKDVFSILRGIIVFQLPKISKIAPPVNRDAFGVHQVAAKAIFGHYPARLEMAKIATRLVANLPDVAFESRPDHIIEYVFRNRVARCPDSEMQQTYLRQSITDFNTLASGTAPTTLFQQGIWQDAPEDKLKAFKQWQKRLHKELKQIGLGFVQQDLEKLFQGELISDARFNVYLSSLEFEETLLNNPKKLAEFFAAADQGKVLQTKANPRVRVMLVGPGGAGKTSLYQLLTKRKAELSNDVTVAIGMGEVDLAMHRKHIPGLPNVELDITLWDFGGQSMFYNLHRGFMRRHNCVYVLVVDSRHEQAPDDWLAQIQHYASGSSAFSQEFNAVSQENSASDQATSTFVKSENAKVLVVTNQYENINRAQNPNYLQRAFGGLVSEQSFYSFNCTEADGNFDNFVTGLVGACIGSQRQIMPYTVQGLANLSQQFKQDNFIRLGKLASCFGMNSSSDEFVQEMSDLEDLGFIVRLNRQGGGDNYCLKPQWVTSTAYHAINAKMLREKAGNISLTEFEDLLQNELNITSESEQTNIVQFLTMQQVVHSRKVKGQTWLLFADAAPAQEPAFVKTVLERGRVNAHVRASANNGSDESEQAIGCITIEYQLAAFPMGLKSHLAIALLENKSGLVATGGDREKDGDREGADDTKVNTPSEQITLWRDGVYVTFANAVELVLFYHPSKQKIVLEWRYPLAAVARERANKRLPAILQLGNEQAEIPESLLARPLEVIDNLIHLEGTQPRSDEKQHIRQMPVLVDNSGQLNTEQRNSIFHFINGYKKTEVEKEPKMSGRGRSDRGQTNINVERGAVLNLDQRTQEINADDGGLINVNQGDGAQQYITNSQTHSSTQEVRTEPVSQQSPNTDTSLPKSANWFVLTMTTLGALAAVAAIVIPMYFSG